jgi:sensor histidine kinase regulating citrate/malate metabolism
MHSKATKQGISFDFILTENIKEVAENTLSREQLSTLLADLIENAIIAVSHNPEKNLSKKIAVSMAIVQDILEIEIQDSGISFAPETLKKLGIEKATTYQDSGGSGIGYLTVFKILKENNGSLVINESFKENPNFTKSIIVRFDDKGEFIVISHTGLQNTSLVINHQEVEIYTA